MFLRVQRPPLPTFERPQAEARIALLLFALLAVIVVALTAISNPIHDIHNLPSESKIRLLLGSLVLLLPVVTVLMLRKQGLDTCLVPKKAFVFHLAVSLAMGFLGMFVYAAAVGKVQMLLSVASKLLTFSSLFLLVPVIVEEFVFREFLLARLTAGFGQHNGVFLSAMLFGLIHYPRHLLSSETSFLQATQVIVLIIAVSVGGGYGIYAIRCMFYGVFIHWGMNFIQASIQ